VWSSRKQTAPFKGESVAYERDRGRERERERERGRGEAPNGLGGIKAISDNELRPQTSGGGQQVCVGKKAEKKISSPIVNPFRIVKKRIERGNIPSVKILFVVNT